mgnify:CR=1
MKKRKPAGTDVIAEMRNRYEKNVNINANRNANIE